MRSLSLAVLAALPALALAVHPAPGADLPEIQARGALRVLVVDGSPAFFGLPPGAAPGLDREILEGFARLHKIGLEPIEIPSWAALVPALLAGKGDVIAGGVTATPGRSRLIDFTVEVFPSRNVVLTRKPHRVVRTLDELRKERVGTIKGSSMAEAIAEAGVPPGNLDDSLASGGAPEALKRGKISATVLGIEDALLDQRADPDLQLGLFLGSPVSLGFGVSRDTPQLKRALDEYVSNLRHTATWNRLVVKYFGSLAPEVLKRARLQ